jgi:hypothetical protein
VNDCPCGAEPRRPGQKNGLACHRKAQAFYRALDRIEPPAPGEAVITFVVRCPATMAGPIVEHIAAKLPGYAHPERATIRRHGRRPEHWSPHAE